MKTTDAMRTIDNTGVARRALATIIRHAADARIVCVSVWPTGPVVIHLDKVEDLDTLGDVLGFTERVDHTSDDGSRHFTRRGTLAEPYNVCAVVLRVCELAQPV